MASLHCHGDSDCNKTQIIRNFHHYNIIIQLWHPLPHIFTHAEVVNAQTWEVSSQKIQSSHLNLNSNCMYKDTSYLGSKLPQVTFSKRNEHCSFRLMEQNKTKHPLALSRVEPRVAKFDNYSSNVLIQDER